jgi:rubredoxin
VGRVVEAEVVREGEPMTYSYYQEVKGGTTPKAAPSYRPPEVKRMDKYRCSVCGYLYDPEKGDPDGGIPPGTPFEALPEGWVCPVCGADKSLFRKVEG